MNGVFYLTCGRNPHSDLFVCVTWLKIAANLANSNWQAIGGGSGLKILQGAYKLASSSLQVVLARHERCMDQVMRM